jgi:mannose-6-phosphate isomerase-like protein (cupin superfamily)
MRKIIWTFSLLVAMALPAQSSSRPNPAGASQASVSPPHAMSARYGDLQWQAIVPEMGADSPQVSILRVDTNTHATQLLIRVPKQMHVPMHWHSANETHTVIKGTWVFEHDGERDELGPGGFNYLPARMHHQAWSSDGALVFITVDSGWDVNWVNGPPTRSDLGQRSPSR